MDTHYVNYVTMFLMTSQVTQLKIVLRYFWLLLGCRFYLTREAKMKVTVNGPL